MSGVWSVEWKWMTLDIVINFIKSGYDSKCCSVLQCVAVFWWMSGGWSVEWTWRTLDIARSREDETRNGHQNTKRNPRWSKFRSLFEWDLWKETCDDHRGFRFVWHSDGHFESLLLGNGLYRHHLHQDGIVIPPKNREIPFETPRTPLLLVI